MENNSSDFGQELKKSSFIATLMVEMTMLRYLASNNNDDGGLHITMGSCC